MRSAQKTMRSSQRVLQRLANLRERGRSRRSSPMLKLLSHRSMHVKATLFWRIEELLGPARRVVGVIKLPESGQELGSTGLKNRSGTVSLQLGAGAHKKRHNQILGTPMRHGVPKILRRGKVVGGANHRPLPYKVGALLDPCLLWPREHATDHAQAITALASLDPSLVQRVPDGMRGAVPHPKIVMAGPRSTLPQTHLLHWRAQMILCSLDGLDASLVLLETEANRESDLPKPALHTVAGEGLHDICAVVPTHEPQAYVPDKRPQLQRQHQQS